MATPSQHILDIKGDVAHRLEANGALDQIRAQIRASVYRALLGAQDSNSVESRSDSDGRREAPQQMVSLVADFLESLDLDMTKEVFLRESSEKPVERRELEKELEGCIGTEQSNADGAVLERVIQVAQERASRMGTIQEDEVNG
eukprot:TRINITY_DN93497_c0_g1_i1.p1 TRINITY_DN93497_c0_g1~~TRINITY_DN93497_c0_g1_i1.p1  ORF type:complete len:144 (+),score=25.37 TRINITY_DN93497_c0_g1_i1:78-509(+)